MTTPPSPLAEVIEAVVPKPEKEWGNWRHGMSSGKGRHPLYCVWRTMISRCYREKDKSYSRYGGRGIYVWEQWHGFSQFAKDMLVSYEEHVHIHGKSNTQIDRKDNRKGYYPKNVRWATKEEQARNKASKANTASPFKGVSKSGGGKWQAEIRASGKRKYLGVFKTQEEAAHAYDAVAKDWHGDFAYLNFPNHA